MIEIIKKISADPGTYARSLSESGKKIIGHFCTYTPEEIIHAAGAHPMRLFGTTGEISLADAHLQSYCCSLAKGALEEGLAGRLEYLHGVVFPHTCDTMQRLSDIWRLNSELKHFADIVLPVKLNSSSALQYMIEVLGKFRSDLEEGLNVKISDDSIRDSIGKYNKIRNILKEIYEVRSKNPELISGSAVYSIMKAAMIVDRDTMIEYLPQIVNEINEGLYKTVAGVRKRVILAGSICTHPDIYDIIENAGGAVVWDDLCTGSRYFENDIATDGDPVEAIARRYYEKAICPAKHKSLTERARGIIKNAREKGAQGVIFLHLKFCDPHSFDYPYIKQELDIEHIPSTLIEIDSSSVSEGQLRTRFETFIEML